MVELRRRTVLAGMGAAGLAGGLGGCAVFRGPGLQLAMPAIGAVAQAKALDGPARGPASAGENPYVDQLGRGFDSVFDDLMGPMVTGSIVRSPVAPTDFDIRNGLKWQMIETQKDYYAFSKKSGRAKARYGLFKGGASGGKTSEKTSNSYSLHICAYARRVDQSLQLNKDTLRLTQQAERALRAERDPNLRLRDWGDSFISGVIPGSELIIDVTFETSSRSAKTNCQASMSASYGKLVSASGSLSQVINSASSYKKVVVEIIGVDASTVPKQYTPEEAQRIIERFLANADTQSSVWDMNVRPVSDLFLRNRKLDFVDFQGIRRREAFTNRAQNRLEYLDYVEADAGYVHDNRGEFDAATVERAEKDLETLAAARKKVWELGTDAYAQFRNDGKTGDRFDVARLDAAVPTFDEYLQKEPAAPVARPKPKPRREYEHNDRPHGREG